MILMDGSHMLHKLVFGNIQDLIEPDTNMLKTNYLTHLILSNIIMKIKLFGASKFNRMVIAMDSKPYWREEYWNQNVNNYFDNYTYDTKNKKDILFEVNIEDYQKYKGNRKKDDNIPWNEIYNVYETVMNFLKENSDIMVMQVKSAEADDIIAVLSRQYCVVEEIFIVGADKDLKQLLKYNNVHFYKDSFKKAGESDWFELNIDEANQFLLQLILIGDKGDNIPNIMPKLGEKTALKYIANNCELLNILLETKANVKNRFEINRTMIDFEYIPKHLQQHIIEMFHTFYKNNYNYNMLNWIDFNLNYNLNEIGKQYQLFRLKDDKIETRLNTYFSKKNSKSIEINSYNDNVLAEFNLI